MYNFEIGYTLADGTEDSFKVSGETLDEIREKAQKEVDKRGGQNPWSREL